MAIAAILIGLGTFSLLGLQYQTAMNGTVDSLTTDLRTQQLITMTGEATKGAGIYFNLDNYVLFSGPAYNPGSGANLTVKLSDNIVVSEISYSNQTIFFAPGTGVASAAGVLKLKDQTNNQEKTFSINSLGTITDVF